MRDYVLMMLATVVAIRLFWIGPICNAIRECPKLVMQTRNDMDERSDDMDGNSSEETNRGV